MYTIYSKENCPFCTKAVQLLESKQQQFQVLKLGEDVDLETFKRDNPKVRSVPYILFNDEIVGGYHELVSRVGNN